MRNTVLALAIVSVMGIPISAHAQTAPFEVGYQWSLSGKEYVTAARPLRQFDQFSFDVVGGYEVGKSVAPSFGFGATYMLEDASGFYLKAGAFALFPQQSKPDLGFGLTFGVKF